MSETAFRIGVLGRLSGVASEALAGIPCTIDPIATPSELTAAHDLALCLSYPRLVPARYLSVPRFGVYVSHASDLPTGRGWAPVNWALIRDQERIHVTTFRAVEECDAGPIFRKDATGLTPTDTITSAYEKVKDVVREHIRTLVSMLRRGEVPPLTPQEGAPTWYPRRTPADAELDPRKSLAELWPLLRACDNDAYPAFFRLHGKRIFIRYAVVDEPSGPAPDLRHDREEA